jgi:hypothetical protein
VSAVLRQNMYPGTPKICTSRSIRICILVLQAERLESLDLTASPHLSPYKKRSENQRLDRLELRLAGKSVWHIVGLAETPARYLPPPPGGSPRKWAKTGQNGHFGHLWRAGSRQRWQTSGRGLGQPHYVPHALSSEPKLKAIQTLVLRHFFFVGGNVW